MLPGQDHPWLQPSLPSGVPAKVGTGFSGHVVVLWPNGGPFPSRVHSWNHTQGQFTMPSAQRNVATLLDRIATALGLCKRASQSSWSSDGLDSVELRHGTRGRKNSRQS